MRAGRAMNIARPDGRRAHLIVFSDLDQTLLDGRDYSHAKAMPGLALLEEQDRLSGTRQGRVLVRSAKIRLACQPLCLGGIRDNRLEFLTGNDLSYNYRQFFCSIKTLLRPGSDVFMKILESRSHVD
jgi:hypothetical protein